MSPGHLNKVIGTKDHVTLKCSKPEDFNDPYELFLTIDFHQEPAVLAFYKDVIGELPQLPTTCFSHLPTVIPMWAHYGQNSQGICLEFDEERLVEKFPGIKLVDVQYRDTPDDHSHLLALAFEIGKYRHVAMLQQALFRSAYYTKMSCWSYEEERRLVVADEYIRKQDGLLLMDVPSDCVTSLICGPRASSDTKTSVRAKADQLGCDYYDCRTGRSSAVPFFTDLRGDSSLFDGQAITPITHSCASCQEPVDSVGDLCSWCQIDESHTQDAASRNSLRDCCRIRFAYFLAVSSKLKHTRA
jgi:hypothetical protein